MSENTQQPTNDPLTGRSYKNSNDNIYDVPNNKIVLQKVIPRERENKLYQVGNIEFCYKCMKNDNKYCPVFTYTTTFKSRNGTIKKIVLNSHVCTIHDAEERFPDYCSKNMFTNEQTQRKYEILIEKRYFQSNRSSEFYKMIFENQLNINMSNNEYSSGISSLQTLYNEIFDIDQELFLLFEKKRFVENNSTSVAKKSKVQPVCDSEMYVEMKPNVAYQGSNCQTNEVPTETTQKDVQCMFKNLKMRNRNGFEYKGSLSTERVVYYQSGVLKMYDILRVPHVIEHVTLGGILGKNDLLEFGKYLKNEVFTKRQRKVEHVKVKENTLEMSSNSIRALKNITIIKYTMEDYPFMVSAIINWISYGNNCSKLIYPRW